MSLYFIETQAFTRRVQALALESGVPSLQAELAANPERGVLDPGTDGLRKVRMLDVARGKGKRSGARVHYLYLPAHRVVYLIFVYGKHEQISLTASQKKQLRAVVDSIRAEWR